MFAFALVDVGSAGDGFWDQHRTRLTRSRDEHLLLGQEHRNMSPKALKSMCIHLPVRTDHGHTEPRVN